MLQIDPKNIDGVKEILRLGQNTEFWKIICDALNDSITHLQSEQDGEAIKDLPSEQYKFETELLKAKRKYLAHLKVLPDTLIAFFAQPAGNVEKPLNFDPYYQESEIAEALKKEQEAP